MLAEEEEKKKEERQRKKDSLKELCQRKENGVLCNLSLLCIIPGIK